jgi:hypothetical protein
MELVAALSIVAFIFSLLALPVALYSIVIVKALQASTHKIEYVAPSSPLETAENLRHLSRVTNPTNEVPPVDDEMYTGLVEDELEEL